jgi:predicted amidohydrolase YtcJ
MRILMLGGLLALVAGATQAAELYLVGGRIFTADPERPAAEALAIRDGRIVAVGSSTEIRALAADAPAGAILDLGGRRVVPGLIEAHGHAGPALPGRAAPMPNLPWPGPTPDEALKAIADAAGQGPGWIDGETGPLVVNDPRNWRQALDAVAPNNPVMLRPWWGHGMLLNSAALKTLGVPEDVPDPLGGWYGRDAAGRLDGRIRETPEWSLMRRRAATIDPATTAAAYRATAMLYAGWGVTTYHHMMHNQPLGEGLRALSAAKLPIKWSVYGWAAPQREASDAWDMFKGAASSAPNVRIAGIKWVLDATPIERDAYLTAPYADRPGWRGRPNYRTSDLDAMLRATLAHDRQPALHVVGDGQLAELMARMEALAPAETWRGRRVRIEHADGLTPGLLARARRLGVVVVTNPLHLDPMQDANGTPMMRARLGDRAADFQPMRTAIAAGVPFAIGSDAGGPPANPFLNMMLAVANPSNPKESLTREQALLAYTRGGAYAEGQERVKGIIRSGMAADLAVLSQDILEVELRALPGTRSLLTLVDGEVAHADGPFVSLKR